ncbi:hypothetical protein BST97_01965 [Nonlabens spongiae]|uniref:Plasmid pRiA4b Orf3-like domain-containing protein n=1 Tax=Nonlabens spongiae TaxID=331648 RepID=A0A1W6MGY8_9FLAO|nr:hypothetical protein [Nonlabens spongiae]ARN76863.1 hypothetical protein BST97_01965 [Nonlabens spongiae]
MIYRLRVLLDAANDCLRDIEIEGDSTLEDFHNVITQSFQLQGDEMASFYSSDEEWNQGQEYCLFDMSEGLNPVQKMAETKIQDVLSKKDTRLIYVYDFLSMWTFLVELAEIVGPTDGIAYPQVIFSMGELPDSPPDKEFEADPRFHDDDEGDDDEEDYYDEENFDNYDDLY